MVDCEDISSENDPLSALLAGDIPFLEGDGVRIFSLFFGGISGGDPVFDSTISSVCNVNLIPPKFAFLFISLFESS